MSKHDDYASMLQMLDYATKAQSMAAGRRREDLDGDDMLQLALTRAVEALRDFSRKHCGGATDLARFARICRVARVIQPYLDAIA